MEDIPTMQKTVFKPCKIPALRDEWLNYEVESCYDCQGTLFYIRSTKGLIYDRGFLNGKVLGGNIYMHFQISEVGYSSVCAECGCRNSGFTKIDDDYVVKEFSDEGDEEFYKECLNIISGREKNPSNNMFNEAKKLKKKLDEWIKRNKVKDPYDTSKKKIAKKKVSKKKSAKKKSE